MVCNVVHDAQRDVLLWEAVLLIDSLFALGAVISLDLLSVLDEEFLMLQLPYGQRLQRTLAAAPPWDPQPCEFPPGGH